MARVIREFESHRFRQFLKEASKPTVWLVGGIRRQSAVRRKELLLRGREMRANRSAYDGFPNPYSNVAVLIEGALASKSPSLLTLRRFLGLLLAGLICGEQQRYG